MMKERAKKILALAIAAVTVVSLAPAEEQIKRTQETKQTMQINLQKAKARICQERH